MLNELLPDMRNLLDLARKMENFDATLFASREFGKTIQPGQSALDERKRMEMESQSLRQKWGI